MQNKPNFPHLSPENEDYAKKQTQFKANFRPISRLAKPMSSKANTESYCVDKEPYNDINNATREIYHSKECQILYHLFHLFFIIADKCLEFDKEFLYEYE